MVNIRVNQDKPPNFRGPNNKLYLVRCFKCDTLHGRENAAGAVASGTCAWCGWKEEANNVQNNK